MGQKCDLADLSPVSPHPMHLAAKMDLFGLGKTRTLSFHMPQDDGCLLETSIEVENEGLASVTEAKENLGVLANSPGVSWPTSVPCGFPAKLLVLSLLLWHPLAFPGLYSLPRLTSRRAVSHAAFSEDLLPAISSQNHPRGSTGKLPLTKWLVSFHPQV